jgi:hypothetical protein
MALPSKGGQQIVVKDDLVEEITIGLTGIEYGRDPEKFSELTASF